MKKGTYYLLSPEVIEDIKCIIENNNVVSLSFLIDILNNNENKLNIDYIYKFEDSNFALTNIEEYKILEDRFSKRLAIIENNTAIMLYIKDINLNDKSLMDKLNELKGKQLNNINNKLKYIEEEIEQLNKKKDDLLKQKEKICYIWQ